MLLPIDVLEKYYYNLEFMVTLDMQKDGDVPEVRQRCKLHCCITSEVVHLEMVPSGLAWFSFCGIHGRRYARWLYTDKYCCLESVS